MAFKHIAPSGFWRETSRRRIAFRFAALGIGLLPLLVLELTLVQLDQPAGDWRIDVLSEANGSRRLFILNPETQHYEISPDRLNWFCPDSFPARKAARTRRIFVLGGSTVQGRPYRTETAFSTWLRISLQACDPQRRWEVINCGGVSYAGYRLAAMLPELMTYDPDMIILYTGHNEFLERQTYGRLQRLPAWLLPILEAAERLRTFQLLRRWTGVGSPSPNPETRKLLSKQVDALLDNQGGLEHYHRDTPPRRLVERDFAENLDAMILHCRRRAVPMIVCCPALNLVNCPPFKSEELPSLNDSQRRRFRTALAAATAGNGTIAERIAALRIAQQIDPLHPSVAYRLGRLLLETGNLQAAHRQLTLAADSDSCPLRIRSSMQDVIRRIAARRNVAMVDIDALMRSASSHGSVGDNLMVDHVHPTIEGHQMIADALLQTLIAKEFVQPEPAWRNRRSQAYAEHLLTLNEAYFARGKQRLEGLRQWAAGRAKRDESRSKPSN